MAAWSDVAPPKEVCSLEMRLRARIDNLVDARDEALHALWEERDRIEELEARIEAGHRKLYETRRSRKLWKERAQAAERMVAQARRRKRTAA